jgi:predicted PurR-regulated permease PerM
MRGDSAKQERRPYEAAATPVAADSVGEAARRAEPNPSDRVGLSGASPATQRIARFVLGTAVLGAAGWILFDFLPALAWAGVLAIALAPLYRRLLYLLPHRSDRITGPLLATIVVAIVVIVPLVLLGVALAREGRVVIHFIAEARHHGVAVPYWLHELPFVGPPLADWWRTHLTDPIMADELFGGINILTVTKSARQYGAVVVHRIVLLLFTLLTLFFLFRDGAGLAERTLGLSDRLLGRRGERVARHMVAAVHGTVLGLVLIGLAEGVVLGFVYLAVGLPYPASVGAATAVAAIIPFGAPIVFCVAGVYMFTVGDTFGGLIIIAAGFVVLFVADHFVRPALIGGATRIPFLLVLLGLLGGLETMGLLGLFLGPAIMAALVAMWRDWTERRPAAAPRSSGG